jgi:hypothetical protein
MFSIRRPLRIDGGVKEYPVDCLHASPDVLNKAASDDRWRRTGVPRI